MDRKIDRPLTLEETKLLFRLSVQDAVQYGILGRLNAKQLTAAGFVVGLALGAFPSLRRVLGTVLWKYMNG